MLMKNHIHTLLAVIILGFGVVSSHAGNVTNAVTLVQIDSKEFGDTNSLIKIVEFERNTNISKLRMTHQKMGSSVGSSMFIMRGFYEVAKARGEEYFINLKEWDDKDGSRIYIAGFTNTKDADLKKEFGAEYDYNNEFGQKRDFMSVSQLKMYFEK
jgi:PIN domain nuclease of toxin-antitoxin system